MSSRIEGNLPSTLPVSEQRRDKIQAVALFALAQECSFPYRVHEFDIQDQELLTKLAKICAQKNGLYTAQYFANFKIRDEKARIEIAWRCLQENIEEEDIVCFLPNFEIKNPDALVKILKFCAERFGYEVAQIIHKFDNIPTKERLEIAWRSVKSDGTCALNIKNFGVRDKDVLFEMAKVCMSQGGTAYVKNFDVQEEEKRVLLAKISARKAGALTLNYLDEFEIENPEALKEVIKLALHGTGVTKRLRKFNFDRETLIEMLKIAALHDRLFSAEIKHFSLDQKTLVELAKLNVRRFAASVGYWFERFKIEDDERRVEIALLAARKDGSETALQLPNFNIQDKEKRRAILRICALNSPTGLEHLPFSDPVLEDCASALRCKDQRKAALVRILEILLPKTHQFKDVITEISQYRDAKMALYLIDHFREIDPDLYKQVIGYKHLLLSMIIPCKWADQSTLPLLKSIQRVLISLRKQFRDCASGLEQTWLLALQRLDQMSLSAKRKLEIMARISLESDLQILLNTLLALNDCEELLEEHPLENPKRDLFQLLASNLPHVKIENLGEKYLKICASSRFPAAWKIYKTALRPSFHALFDEFMVSVLNGNLKEKRYRVNPHIEKILENHASVWGKWKKGSESVSLGDDMRIVNTDEWEDLLLCGTEIMGSCLNIYGGHKALLSYLMDGKIRLIAIKRGEKILARSILKLLWDERNKKPVLFQEKSYGGYDSILRSFIQNWALKLQLDFYEDVPSHLKIVSLGSSAPFEYVDYLGKLTNGSYRL